MRPNVRQCHSEGADPAAAMDLHFYKAWDVFGSLSNFAPFQITMPSGAGGKDETWSTLEHYYQAYKFKGVEEAADTCELAPSPTSFCSGAEVVMGTSGAMSLRCVLRVTSTPPMPLSIHPHLTSSHPAASQRRRLPPLDGIGNLRVLIRLLPRERSLVLLE